MEFEAAADLVDDVAGWDLVVMLLGDGLVEVGVESFASGIDGFDAALAEEVLELAFDELEAFCDGFGFWGFASGLQAELEAVKDRE